MHLHVRFEFPEPGQWAQRSVRWTYESADPLKCAPPGKFLWHRLQWTWQNIFMSFSWRWWHFVAKGRFRVLFCHREVSDANRLADSFLALRSWVSHCSLLNLWFLWLRWTQPNFFLLGLDLPWSNPSLLMAAPQSLPLVGRLCCGGFDPWWATWSSSHTAEICLQQYRCPPSLKQQLLGETWPTNDQNLPPEDPVESCVHLLQCLVGKTGGGKLHRYPGSNYDRRDQNWCLISWKHEREHVEKGAVFSF